MKRLFRGLKPNVYALGLTSFFTDFASEMVFPLMPFFLTGVLHASKSTLGLVEGSADSLAALLRIVSGWASDRVGKRKPFIFWGYALSSVARPFYAIATAGWHVLAIRLTDRLGKGTRLAARDALIADSCEKGDRGRAFGLQGAMDNFGAALGPILASLLLYWGVPLRRVFLLTAIPAAAVMIVIAVFVRDIRSTAPPAQLRLSLKPFGGRFRWFLLTIAVFTMANSSDAFLVQRAPDCGIPIVWVPIFWAGFSTLRSLLALPGGALADRFDRRYVVLAGWLIYAGCYAGLAFAGTPGPFLALIAVYAAFSALATSNLRAIVVDLVPADLRGTAFGLFYFAIGLVSLPSSLLFGALSEHASPRTAFLTDAALALVACVMLLMLRAGKAAAGDVAKG